MTYIILREKLQQLLQTLYFRIWVTSIVMGFQGPNAAVLDQVEFVVKNGINHFTVMKIKFNL